MYIYSVTLTKEKIALLLVFLLLALLGAGCLLSLFSKDGIRDTNHERRRFLEEMGYQTEKRAYLEERVVLPEEFDAYYQEYEALQKKQGFSLEAYRGKRVKKYTYRIIGQAEDNLYANLFFYKNRLIGADLHCPSLQNGFVKPLLNRED